MCNILQIPINILDHRLVKENYLGELKSYGIELHARSVFLQGLLLMPRNSIPNYFQLLVKLMDLV